LLAHGQWFSLGTPASSTTKTGCHDIAEILLEVALKHQKINQSIKINQMCSSREVSLDITCHKFLSPEKCDNQMT
jgi:ribosome biogenesis SPOUT family RNA methylase Rps3